MAGSWSVAGASTAGTKHRRSGWPCEDAWASTHRDDVDLYVIADGAGSADRGADGARSAVQAAGSVLECRPELRRQSPGAIARAAMRAAAERVATVAQSAQIPIERFSTTLTVVAVRDDRLAATQVGDCLAVLRSESECRVLAYPTGPSRFVEETEFLSVARANEAPVIDAVVALDDPSLGLVLSTDGLAPLLLQQWDPPIPHRPFFDSLFTAAVEGRASSDDLSRFLDSPEVCQRTDDDKTLVLAVRR